MRYVFFALAILPMAYLSSETIGQVEYHLPSQGSSWKIEKDMRGNDSINSHTVIYIPQNASLENAQEFFAVHVNDLPSYSVDEAALEKVIESQFPNQEVSVKILEQNPESLIYEWAVGDQENEKIHGWTRIFLGDQNTTMLTYLTKQVDLVDQERPIWLQTLKDAHLPKKEASEPASEPTKEPALVK